MKHIEVVAAVIVFDYREILCVQRDTAKYQYISRKWEFPGGKVETGESLEEAIRREIREELVTDLQVCDPFLIVDYQYPDFFIKMHSYLCYVSVKNVTLTEHIDQRWLRPYELTSLDWAAADLPIVQKLQETDLCP